MADNTYRILTKIAETGSLTRTAEQLNYTQARVSQILKSAETEFGLTLFVRGKRGVMPTPECRCLLPTLQELVRQELVLLDQLDQIRDLRGGTVSIGTFTSVSCHWLPQRLKAFGQLYPQIRFQLKLGDVAHIDQWLREGTVDLGLMIDPETEDLTFLPLLEDCYPAPGTSPGRSGGAEPGAAAGGMLHPAGAGGQCPGGTAAAAGRGPGGLSGKG